MPAKKKPAAKTKAKATKRKTSAKKTAPPKAAAKSEASKSTTPKPKKNAKAGKASSKKPTAFERIRGGIVKLLGIGKKKKTKPNKQPALPTQTIVTADILASRVPGSPPPPPGAKDASET